MIVKCIYGGFEVRYRAKSCSNVNLSSPPDGCCENHTTVEKIQQESGEMLYYGYYQNKKAKYRTKGNELHQDDLKEKDDFMHPILQNSLRQNCYSAGRN